MQPGAMLSQGGRGPGWNLVHTGVPEVMGSFRAGATYPNWLIGGLQPRSNGQTATLRRPWPTAAKCSMRGGSTVANAHGIHGVHDPASGLSVAAPW